MSEVYAISNNELTLSDLSRVVLPHFQIKLSEESRKRIQRCRDYLDQKLAQTTGNLYGINTGFGSLYNRNIPPAELEKLQDNLVKSHA